MNEPELRFKADDGSEFPEWEEKQLGKMFDIFAGGDISKSDCSKTKSSEFCYPVYANALTDDGLYGYANYYKIDGDSVTITGRGDIGFAIARHCKYVPIVRLIVLHPCTDENVNFFANAINSIRIPKEYTGVPQLTAPQVSQTKLMVPCIEEQQKIADLFSTLDNVINSVQKEVDSWEQMKHGMMQKLFSQEVRFKADDGTEFPEWEERNLSDVCNIVGGGTPSTDHTEYWDGDIQWFTPTEIGHSKYVTNSKRTITDIGLSKSSAKLLPVGTILLTTRATLGEMSIAEKQCCTNQGFQSLIVKSGTSRDYIFYLQGKIKNYCVKHAAGSTFQEISGKNLGKCHIPYPCFEEQQKIADCLSEFDSVIEKTKQKLEAYKQLKKGLIQRMFV